MMLTQIVSDKDIFQLRIPLLTRNHFVNGYLLSHEHLIYKFCLYSVNVCRRNMLRIFGKLT